MNERTVPVTEDELHALLDGELPADRRQEVEAWLAAHPDDAARLAAWRSQDDAIRVRFGSVADEPVPERLDLDRLVRGGRSRRMLIAASVLTAFLLGGSAGWFGRATFEGDRAPPAKMAVVEALQAHRLYIAEVRHPVEVAADAKHLLPWLSRRLGNDLRAPNLKTFGLKLIGGRLLPGPKGPAALLMYEGPSGERFTLYCARVSAPDSALRYREADGVAAFYWVENEISFVISGPANRDRLQKVAETAYEQLDSGQRMRPPQRNTRIQ
jgi:anti-sigma factor RsiW